MVTEHDVTDLLNAIQPVDPAPAGAAPGAEDVQIPNGGEPQSREALTPEYAHPLAREIDELARKGATKEEINQFLRLSNLNADGMTPDALVMEDLRMQYPNLSAEDIRELYDAEYGEADAKTKAKLQKAAADVRKKIAELQDKARMPDAERTRQAQADTLQKTAQAWSQVADKLAETRMAEIKVQIDDQNHFAFPVDEQIRKAAALEAVGYAVRENIPFDQKSLPAIQEHMENVIFYLAGKQIVQAAVKDALAKGQRNGLRQHVNPAAPREAPQQRVVDKDWIGNTRAKPFA